MELTSRTQFWHGHVAEYLGGSQALKAYCEEHQLNARTCGHWRRKLTVDDSVVAVGHDVNSTPVLGRLHHDYQSAA